MNAFHTAWTVLKEDNEKCPGCGMKKSNCMQKMGCGTMKKGYMLRKSALYHRYDYNTIRKEYEDYSEGPEMNDNPMSEEIYDDHKPRNDKEARILQHYKEKLGTTGDREPYMGFSGEDQTGIDDEEHGLRSDIAQEYFVQHMREMNAMQTGNSMGAMQGMGQNSALPRNE